MLTKRSARTENALLNAYINRKTDKRTGELTRVMMETLSAHVQSVSVMYAVFYARASIPVFYTN